MIRRRLPVLILPLLACLSHAFADEPAKDPRQEEFRKATQVIVAKLESAAVTGLQESFPPRYLYSISLIPTEVLRGNFEKGKAIKCNYAIASVNEPKLPVGKEVLVQLETTPKNGLRIVKMEEPAAKLLALAKTATAAGKAQADREDELARKEPEKHPQFNAYKEAAGVAILTADENGVAAFDVSSRTTILATKALEILKGELKMGAIRVHIPPAVKPPLAKKWLVTFKVDKGKVWLVSAEEASETALLVAQAATKK